MDEGVDLGCGGFGRVWPLVVGVGDDEDFDGRHFVAGVQSAVFTDIGDWSVVFGETRHSSDLSILKHEIKEKD